MRHANINNKGFTLFELLICLSLGLVIMLSAAYLAVQLLRSASLNLEQSGLNDAKQVLNETMESDFKQAGTYLCNLTPAAVSATSYASEVQRDAPALWYRLDEPSSSATIADSSGNNRSATVTGSVTFGNLSALASDPDPSISLQGRSSGYVTGPNFGTPSGDYSIEWWLNPSALSNYGQFITTNRAGAYNTWGFLTLADGSVYCGPDQTTAFTPSDIPAGTIKTGRWQHLVYTYSAGQGSLYLNGSLLAAKIQNAPTAWDTISLYNVTGATDELAYYQQALTPDRIKAHYIAGVAPPVPQDEPGLKMALLPLVRWPQTTINLNPWLDILPVDTEPLYQRPPEPIWVDPAGQSAIILSADPNFSPVSTRTAYTPPSSYEVALQNPGSPTLQTSVGTRSAPQIGDFLLVIDYAGNQSALVQVTNVPETVTDASGNEIWSIETTLVTQDNPAWNIMASDYRDANDLLPQGSTVVRMTPPVIYSTYTDGTTNMLLRQVAEAKQTLALGVTSFTIQRSTTNTPASWTINYQMESEELESSTDPGYKQLGTGQLTFTPVALNPETR